MKNKSPKQIDAPSAENMSMSQKILMCLDQAEEWEDSAIEAIMAMPGQPRHKRIAMNLVYFAGSRELNGKGDPICLPFIREIMDRQLGRPKQTSEISGANGGPVKTEVTTLAKIDYEQLRNDLESFALENANGRISANGRSESVHPDNSN